MSKENPDVKFLVESIKAKISEMSDFLERKPGPNVGNLPIFFTKEEGGI